MPNYLERVATSGTGRGVAAKPPATAPPLSPGPAIEIPRRSVFADEAAPEVRAAQPTPAPVPAAAILPIERRRESADAATEVNAAEYPEAAPRTEPVIAARSPEGQERDLSVEPAGPPRVEPPLAMAAPGLPADAVRSIQFTPPPPSARETVSTSSPVRISLPGLREQRVIDLPRTLRPMEAPLTSSPAGVAGPKLPDEPADRAEPSLPLPRPADQENLAAPREPGPPRIVPSVPLAAPQPMARAERVSRIEIGQVEVQVFPVAASQAPAPARIPPLPRTDPLEARFLNRFRLRP